MILKLWGVLVLIMIAIMVDECMFLLKVFWRLLAHTESVMRKRFDSAVLRLVFILMYEFKEMSVLHYGKLIKLNSTL